MNDIRRIFRGVELLSFRLAGNLGGQAIRIFALKLATMGLGLISIQLTASFFSGDTFFLLNSILFLVAIHGCINYSAQVVTWKEGGINTTIFFIIQIVTIIISGSFAILNGGNWIFFISVLFYLAYRGNERILFNLQITKGQVAKAYGIIILSLVIEITVAGILYINFGLDADRFILPSICVLAITFPCTIILLYKGRPDMTRTLFSDKRGMLLMSAHSGLIALNVMSDRLVFSSGIGGIKSYLQEYLLVFSYCTSVYAIVISLLEVRRPTLFKSQATSLRNFLKDGGFNRFCAISFLTTSFAGLGIFLGINILSKSIGISDESPVTSFTFYLSIFFLGQALLAYIHVYLLSREFYTVLFATWAVSATVRLVGYLQTEWTLFLALTAFSGFAAIGAAFLLEKKCEK
ncbi:hypothetical protein [Sphingopyxis flava]|uniref:Uncharacterized protein n=1 Tax=Sphingopyxis flava TaxID=1507287 RepID=A0A1T5F5Z1_9SPHN|nr:hypothetical protein [Sphingopyxis flava]SKB91594.1 hypothetical protein SAMN06295937_10299 [Sphingopyxis flava]